MDIDKQSFPARLIDILEAVSNSCFVSFDLELSGVPVKQPRASPGKPSLQERYTETKAAAEKFQILQIGLTCVQEDVQKGAYVCRPFNFNLNPIIEERLDVDRTFSFHSGAVEFLLGVGFKIDLPFTAGVPYMSRKEAELALDKAVARQNRGAIPDIDVKPDDARAQEFVRRVRAEIDVWQQNQGSRSDYILIGPPAAESRSELNRFEQRLAHQTVRTYYSNLITIHSRGLIRVSKFDAEREEFFRKQRNKDVQARIARQTGFRWIIEAMCGNPLDDIDVTSFAQTFSGISTTVNLAALEARFSRIKDSTKGKKTILVGHNLFLDLIYLYKTFIGDLPDTVDQFSALIRSHFPLIVDTKYMATHKCQGVINSQQQSSLEDIAAMLAPEMYPVIEIPAEYSKYNGASAFHEAGYDSMLTARVAIRLSAKIELALSYVEREDESEHPPPSAARIGNQLSGSRTASALPGLSVTGIQDMLKRSFKTSLGNTQQKGEEASELETDSKTAALLSKTQSLVENMSVSDQKDTDDASSWEVSKQSKNAEKNKKKKERKKKNKLALRTSSDLPPPYTPFAHPTVYDHLLDADDDHNSDSDKTVTGEDIDGMRVLQYDTQPSDQTCASDPVVADTDGVSEGVQNVGDGIGNVEPAATDNAGVSEAAQGLLQLSMAQQGFMQREGWNYKEFSAAQRSLMERTGWKPPETFEEQWECGRESGLAMPAFTSQFWNVYGNKLRVFGTEEGVVMLDAADDMTVVDQAD